MPTAKCYPRTTLKLCGQLACHTPCRIRAAATLVGLEDDVTLAINLYDGNMIDHVVVASIV
jgi:hypothetical protein